jgi:hypothetical protein
MEAYHGYVHKDGFYWIDRDEDDRAERHQPEYDRRTYREADGTEVAVSARKTDRRFEGAIEI